MFRALVRALEESESHRLRAHRGTVEEYIVMQLCHTYDLAHESERKRCPATASLP